MACVRDTQVTVIESTTKKSRLDQMSFCTHEYSRLLFLFAFACCCSVHLANAGCRLGLSRRSVVGRWRKKENENEACDKYIKHKHVGIHAQFQRKHILLLFGLSARGEQNEKKNCQKILVLLRCMRDSGPGIFG